MQSAQTPSVLGSWCIRPFVCGVKRLALSLKHALQHGRGIGGSGLSALDGAAEILDTPTALPDFLKLPRKDLRSSLP